jgi:hypothetical protein
MPMEIGWLCPRVEVPVTKGLDTSEALQRPAYRGSRRGSMQRAWLAMERRRSEWKLAKF